MGSLIFCDIVSKFDKPFYDFIKLKTMVYTCGRCRQEFKLEKHYQNHLQRVNPCKKRKINDIHQHIRVVSMLDKVGLDYDIISVVLEKYRERLTGLPKPLNFTIELPTFCEGVLQLPPSLWFQKTISLEKWIHYKFRISKKISEKEIQNKEKEGQEIRIKNLVRMVDNSKTDGTSTDIWCHLDGSRITIPPIPHGYKGVVWENIKFMGRLNNTKQRGTTNHWCDLFGSDCRGFINYKKLDKTMKYWKLSPLQIKMNKLEILEKMVGDGVINEGEYLRRVNML